MDTQMTTKETISHIGYLFHSIRLRSADDVTIHYTARYNFDSGTWKMTSDSLDIDFIHSDIRNRSCKNWIYPMSTTASYFLRPFDKQCERPNVIVKVLTFIEIHYNGDFLDHILTLVSVMCVNVCW